MFVCTARSFSKPGGRARLAFLFPKTANWARSTRFGPFFMAALIGQTSGVNNQSRSATQSRQQPQQVITPKRDATRRGLIARLGHVHENRATAALYTWPPVVIENDDDVV